MEAIADLRRSVRGRGERTAPRATGSWLRCSRVLVDPPWDAFVGGAEDGHFIQTAAWASFKATAGWRAARITVGQDDAVLAGAQMLIRSVPVVGAIGYVREGPVVGDCGGEAMDVMLDGLLALCRSERVRYLVVKPPRVNADLIARLERRGFCENARFTAHLATATVRVDLTPPPDQILARMRRSTRGNIRRGRSRGLRAREGTAADFELFCDLEVAAAQRKGYSIWSHSRHMELWNALSEAGMARLFLVEDEEEGEPVSAQVAVAFGGTMYSLRMAWSGQQSSRKPNELLEWTVMMWAKQQGHRHYDFEGVDSGHAAGSGADRPDAYVSDYKLGYGGEFIQTSPAYDLVLNPILRWGYRSVLPRVERLTVVRSFEKWLMRSLSEQRQSLERGPAASTDELRVETADTA
jgi:lipid II:glycine glycyltransferase (peptidoglycan interpeptide bridge formation enzyme)